MSLRVAERISPELVATILVALIGTALVASNIKWPSIAQAVATPSASPTASPTSNLLEPIVRSSLATIIIVNEQLAGMGQGLAAELAKPKPAATDIALLLPRITAAITAADEPVRQLTGHPLTASLGSDLDDAYQAISDLVRGTLGQSLQNGQAYRTGGAAIVEKLAALTPLTARARVLLAGPPPTPSARPSPSQIPSASPFRSVAPTPSPTSTASGIGPATDGGLVANPGFEAGPTPWELRVVPPAAAAFSIDRVNPAAGSSSARIDIPSGTDSRSGISLVQSGLALHAGRSYTIALTLRSAATRDIRVRVASTDGATYTARIFGPSTAWTSFTFVFDALVDDPSAQIAIDLGRSTTTVWIDNVAVRETAN